MRNFLLSDKTYKINKTLSDLSSEIFDLIKKIKSQFDHHERNLIRTHYIDGVTPPQLFILRILWKEDGFPLKYLATAAKCARSTITGVVKTMKDNGLVTLESNPKDGRSSLVKLTRKGKELQFYRKPQKSNLTDFFRDFTPSEIENLEILLKKLIYSMED